MLVLAPQVQAKKRPRINIVRDMEPDEDSLLLTVESNNYYAIDYLNTTLDYSTKDGWDFSVSSQNIPVSDGSYAQNYNDDTYFQVSKTWEQSWGQLSLGTMNGFQLFSYSKQDIANGINTPNQLHSFTYGDALYRINDWLRVHSGVFYVNAALSTKTDYVSPLFGIVIGDDELYFQADWTGGHSNVSGAQAAIYYSPYSNLKLYSGLLVPEKNSGNEFSSVIGFTFAFGKQN